MVVAVEDTIESLISALEYREELLHNSLKCLRGNPVRAKEYQEVDIELQNLIYRRQALVALAQFQRKMPVYKTGNSVKGIVAALKVTENGSAEVWVSWNKNTPVPENPLDLRVFVPCEHKFRYVWQSDGTLLDICDCGETQPPSPQSLSAALTNSHVVRNDYLAIAQKTSGKKQQELLEAVNRLDHQINWLNEQLNGRSCGGFTGMESQNADAISSQGISATSPQPPLQEPISATPPTAPAWNKQGNGGTCDHLEVLENNLVIKADQPGAPPIASYRAPASTETKYLAVEFISTDGGTQSRACLQDSTIDEYAEAMDDGAEFPPILVFYDGEKYWLADGFHRVAAAKKRDLGEIAATIRSGTRRDAVLYSVGANATHGLQRTNADKRRSVLTLLGDEEWSCWSDREIARRCGVSTPFASKLRSELSVNGLQIDNGKVSANSRQVERTVTRNGTTYTMDATKIGRNEAAAFKDEGDDSAEPGVPKFEVAALREEPESNHRSDFEAIEAGEKFNTEAKAQKEPLPNLLPLTSDEITISVVSNVDILSDEQLDAIVKAIETERQRRIGQGAI